MSALGKLAMFYIINSDISIKTCKTEKAFGIEFKLNDALEIQSITEKYVDYYNTSTDVILPSLKRHFRVSISNNILYISTNDYDNSITFYTVDADKKTALNSILKSLKAQHSECTTSYSKTKDSNLKNKLNFLAKLYNNISTYSKQLTA